MLSRYRAVITPPVSSLTTSWLTILLTWPTVAQLGFAGRAGVVLLIRFSVSLVSFVIVFAGVRAVNPTVTSPGWFLAIPAHPGYRIEPSNFGLDIFSTLYEIRDCLPGFLLTVHAQNSLAGVTLIVRYSGQKIKFQSVG